MTRPRIPDDVLAAAHARSAARQARDWPEADRLRGEIEAAGWKVVDRGTDFALSPAHPPDVEEGGRIRYGASSSVPSRLAEAPIGVATIVLVTGDDADAVEGTLRPLREHAPEATQLVVVANDPPPALASVLATADRLDPGGPGIQTEVVWTAVPFGHAAALNAGIRRAAAPVVVVVEPGLELCGDVVSPLAETLADPTVAVAGASGRTSRDLRRWQPAPPGDVDVVDGPLMAFRREDYGRRGPLDEAFVAPPWLDAWWSLALRDEGEDGAHRRAVVLEALPLAAPPATADEAAGGSRDRATRRNFYRLLDRFGPRRDLLIGRATPNERTPSSLSR